MTNVNETISKNLVIEDNVALRPMKPADGPAFTTLSQVPDTGRVRIAPYYHLDAYTAFMALKANTTGVVAEKVGTGEMIGAGFVSFGRFQCEGSIRDYAALRSLVVHPAHRRRGIATRLAEWRVAYAMQRVGKEGVIVAAIQQKNDGSLTVAKTWSKQFLSQIQSSALKRRVNRPKPVSDLVVRPATKADMEELTTHLNCFYQEYNFYEPHTPDSLSNWLSETPFATPFRHYYVVANAAGNLLAGMAIIEQYRLAEMRVIHLPAAMRLINKLVKLVPPDGILKQVAASHIWFASGQEVAAHFLCETIHYEWDQRNKTVTVFFDPRSPLKKILPISTWMPKTSFVIAVSGPEMFSEERLVHPV